jgi:hypothetical protein
MSSFDKITTAAKGLYYISETDHPFTVMETPAGEPIETQLIKISGQQTGAPVEQTSLPYFFRNMVKADPNGPAEDEQIAKRFQALQLLLEQELKDITVYRIGQVNIDAFIVGKEANGKLLVLQTRLVET